MENKHIQNEVSQMSDKSNEDLENDKYFKVFKHLESVNLRNKDTFDELLKYTYNNISDEINSVSHNDKQ